MFIPSLPLPVLEILPKNFLYLLKRPTGAPELSLDNNADLSLLDLISIIAQCTKVYPTFQLTVLKW